MSFTFIKDYICSGLVPGAHIQVHPPQPNPKLGQIGPTQNFYGKGLRPNLKTHKGRRSHDHNERLQILDPMRHAEPIIESSKWPPQIAEPNCIHSHPLSPISRRLNLKNQVHYHNLHSYLIAIPDLSVGVLAGITPLEWSSSHPAFSTRIKQLWISYFVWSILDFQILALTSKEYPIYYHDHFAPLQTLKSPFPKWLLFFFFF